MITTGWKSKIPSLLKKERKEIDRVIRASAFRVEALAKLAAPVDTGLLRASIYTTTSRDSSRAQAEGETRKLDPTADLGNEPTVGELTAVVSVGAEYGIYVEMGGKRGAAQPYLEPALEEVARDLRVEVRRLLN